MLLEGWLIGKDPAAGKDWWQEEKGITESEIPWMASPAPWTRAWASSRRWWRTGKPGVLQSMGLQRVGHDRAAELTERKTSQLFILFILHLTIHQIYNFFPWKPNWLSLLLQHNSFLHSSLSTMSFCLSSFSFPLHYLPPFCNLSFLQHSQTLPSPGSLRTQSQLTLGFPSTSVLKCSWCANDWLSETASWPRARRS